MAALEPCIYCPGQRPPRSRAKRRRLLDTRQNRARELALYRAHAAHPSPRPRLDFVNHRGE